MKSMLTHNNPSSDQFACCVMNGHDWLAIMRADAGWEPLGAPNELGPPTDSEHRGSVVWCSLPLFELSCCSAAHSIKIEPDEERATLPLDFHHWADWEPRGQLDQTPMNQINDPFMIALPPLGSKRWQVRGEITTRTASPIRWGARPSALTTSCWAPGAST
jgi:hypothetical protein